MSVFHLLFLLLCLFFYLSIWFPPLSYLPSGLSHTLLNLSILFFPQMPENKRVISHQIKSSDLFRPGLCHVSCCFGTVWLKVQTDILIGALILVKVGLSLLSQWLLKMGGQITGTGSCQVIFHNMYLQRLKKSFLFYQVYNYILLLIKVL